MSVKGCFIFALVALSACAPKKMEPSTPNDVPLGEVAQEETNPKRAASLRTVEEGRLELNRQHLERAAYYFSQAIEIDSSNPYAYFYLGLTRTKSNALAQAEQLYGRAAALFGDTLDWKAEALALRGETLEKLGQKDAARRSYEAALKAHSSNSRAQAALDRLRITSQ